MNSYHEFSIDHLEKWERDVCFQHPSIYFEVPNDIVKSYLDKGLLRDGEWVNLRYGFECGEGWKSLLLEYGEKATEFIRLIGGDSKILGCIMKEKFGELTFQNDVLIPNNLHYSMWTMIESGIENKSRTICELTGRHGRMSRRGGWRKVLCEEKRKELGYTII